MNLYTAYYNSNSNLQNSRETKGYKASPLEIEGNPMEEETSNVVTNEEKVGYVEPENTDEIDFQTKEKN